MLPETSQSYLSATSSLFVPTHWTGPTAAASRIVRSPVAPRGEGTLQSFDNGTWICPAAYSRVVFRCVVLSSTTVSAEERCGGGKVLYCFLFEVNCKSQANLDERMPRSQKHQKKLKGSSQPTDLFKCVICDVDVFGKGNRDMHVASVKNKKA